MTVTDDRIAEILKNARTIAIVGASPKRERPSHLVAEYLINQGYAVIPVRPHVRRILDRRCYGSLSLVPDEIDIVDVFRSAEACPEVAREAVAAGVRVLWLQQGIVSEEAARIAIEGGLEVIMDRCIKTAHQDLVGVTETSRLQEER